MVPKPPIYFSDLNTILSQCTRFTDGQTDRILIAIPHLHYMQRGKNWLFFVASLYGNVSWFCDLL